MLTGITWWPPAEFETRAAVVAIPVRRAPGGLEVWWGRRAARTRLHPGFRVFPGGSVEPGDREIPVRGAGGGRALRCAGAARELFEETGLWIARGASPIDRLAARAQLRSGALSFAELLRGLGAELHAEDLWPVGRSESPVYADCRYEIQYFLVQIEQPSEADKAGADGVELDRGAWVSPRRALQAWRRGDELMIPVIRRAMQILAETGNDLPRARSLLSRRIRRDREPPNAVRELLPGVRVLALHTPTLPPATHTNCVILGESELVIVDPGSPVAGEQERLRMVLQGLCRQGRRLHSVLLTHHHQDHMGGAHALARDFGIPVRAHAETAARTDARGDLKHGSMVSADAQHPVHALHTPGHAPGHLAFLDLNTGAVAAGDLVTALGTVVIDPEEGNMTHYLASLERLRELRPRLLIPGHGAEIGAPDALLSHYLAHRQQREIRVVEALRAASRPVIPDELLAEVYADVPELLHPWALLSLRSHLRKLVDESRVAQRQERFRLIS